MKDCALAVSVTEEKVTVGLSLTSLTRTREPLDGDFEGKETLRAMLGVKLAGMMEEGRREADFRESRRDTVDMMCCVVVILIIWRSRRICDRAIEEFKYFEHSA